MNPSQESREDFYQKTQRIGRGLARTTRLLDLNCSSPRVLDLCMAPGGFSSTTKEFIPSSVIDAVTLPIQLGGYLVMLEGFRNIIYADITMYIEEMSPGEDVPVDHPDMEQFDTTRPFAENKYDIIFCGGTVGKTHPMEEYRHECEYSRLTTSQLVFALNRLKPGGSLVLVLHHVEYWDTVCLLDMFSQFSNIQLFKHSKWYSIGPSFYMVAKNIDLEHGTAKLAIRYWKDLWKYHTFKDFSDVALPSLPLSQPESEFACQLRDEWGAQYLELAQPIWKIQTKRLRSMPFTRPN